jgi:hypothetical protein
LAYMRFGNTCKFAATRANQPHNPAWSTSFKLELKWYILCWTAKRLHLTSFQESIMMLDGQEVARSNRSWCWTAKRLQGRCLQHNSRCARAQEHASLAHHMPLLEAGVAWHTVLATTGVQATWRRALAQWMVAHGRACHTITHAQRPGLYHSAGNMDDVET